jgi:hypothetical protein
MKTSALFALIAVAWLSSWDAQAQSPTLCDTLAKIIASAKPPAKPPGPWASPVHTLDEISGGVVTIDDRGWRPEKREDLLKKLRDEYRASPELLEAVGQQANPSSMPTIHRFGRSSLYLSPTIQGTAYCQRFIFFEAPAGATAHTTEAPPIVQTADETAFCWKRSGVAGEIAGVPAFIVQSDKDSTVELSVTPWRGGKWENACRVTVTFANDFEATDRFCQGVNCDAMAERARWLAEGLDKSHRFGSGILYRKELAADGRLDDYLPTFGGKIQDGYRASYTEFASDTIFLPIVVGSEMFLGRIGHAAFAWRTAPNYLFAAYRMTGNRLEPVAGIYIARIRARPEDIKVD